MTDARNLSEPLDLLSVVRDRRGRRYFRWSYDSHTFAPWRDVGAVHTDTDENFRWVDLRGDRQPVAIESFGVATGNPEPRWLGVCCAACGGRIPVAWLAEVEGCRFCGNQTRDRLPTAEAPR